MKQRWLVVAVGLPLFLWVLLWCPVWATWLLFAAITGIAVYEMIHTAAKDVAKDIYAFVIIESFMLQAGIFYALVRGYDFGLLVSLGAAWVLLMRLFREAVHRFGTEKPFSFKDLAVCFLAGTMLPLMYSAIFLLRAKSVVYVLAPFCVAFVGDALSMYCGMWFGKKTPKFAPNVSPKKTWAGAIGGPIGSAIAMLALGFVSWKLGIYEPNYFALLLVGVVGNVFGQLGDLSMSLIKREVGIKDYSRLFLTHGGVLDRFDSSMFIAPVILFAVLGGLI